MALPRFSPAQQEKASLALGPKRVTFLLCNRFMNPELLGLGFWWLRKLRGPELWGLSLEHGLEVLPFVCLLHSCVLLTISALVF